MPKHAEGSAKLVFLWPPDSCEGGGYQVITTRGGKFVGNIARGTRLETDLAPGSYDFITWNSEKERFGQAPSVERTGVLHADVRPQQTYFVRLAFGEWAVSGPREQWSRTWTGRGPLRRCVESDAALVRLSPQSNLWPHLQEWLDELTPIAADTESGQRWLEQQPWLVATHRDLADARALRLTREARRLASIEPTDGVALVP
ncbi:hypothetical protein AKJ09_11483 [Labilithrix luteola]|uniref:DUF2846 domain-containing protein n=1 Tax=Labilithrix luteola TaxID=1391654 RepID=A0A0K1QHA7_9BACT|nr:hypothetical protein AKJ09_11483 [Labilithrix luteola]